jgi:hypothetical protein
MDQCRVLCAIDSAVSAIGAVIAGLSVLLIPGRRRQQSAAEPDAQTGPRDLSRSQSNDVLDCQSLGVLVGSSSCHLGLV